MDRGMDIEASGEEARQAEERRLEDRLVAYATPLEAEARDGDDDSGGEADRTTAVQREARGPEELRKHGVWLRLMAKAFKVVIRKRLAEDYAGHHHCPMCNDGVKALVRVTRYDITPQESEIVKAGWAAYTGTGVEADKCGGQSGARVCATPNGDTAGASTQSVRALRDHAERRAETRDYRGALHAALRHGIAEAEAEAQRGERGADAGGATEAPGGRATGGAERTGKAKERLPHWLAWPPTVLLYTVNPTGSKSRRIGTGGAGLLTAFKPSAGECEEAAEWEGATRGWEAAMVFTSSEDNHGKAYDRALDLVERVNRGPTAARAKMVEHATAKEWEKDDGDMDVAGGTRRRDPEGKIAACYRKAGGLGRWSEATAPKRPQERERQPTGAGMTREEEDAMLDDWVRAKRSQEYQVADALKARLKRAGVNAEALRPPPGKGARAGGRQQAPRREERGPEQRLDEWVDAKRQRNYAKADSIAGDLRRQGIDPEVARPRPGGSDGRRNAGPYPRGRQTAPEPRQAIAPAKGRGRPRGEEHTTSGSEQEMGKVPPRSRIERWQQ